MLKNLKKMIGALFLLIFVAGASCAAPMGRLVLLRHGESVWNKEDRFTGWSDVALTEKGEKDAFHAGELMKEAGLNFDAVHVSMLSRAVKTAWNSMEGMNALWLPVSSYWRLNERCYGDLEGKPARKWLTRLAPIRSKSGAAVSPRRLPLCPLTIPVRRRRIPAMPNWIAE